MTGGPNLLLSGIVFVISAVAGVIANLQMRRPYERRMRGVPWLAVQFVAMVICFALTMHMLGLVTGHEFTGRAPY